MPYFLVSDVLAAVLVTGGHALKTAEIFLPSAGTSCTLPPLPQNRGYHTADKNICGGGSTEAKAKKCLQWSPDTGTWGDHLTLDVGRDRHVSWTPGTGIGTYLMGGSWSTRTTTLIKPDKSQETGFVLKYESMLVLNLLNAMNGNVISKFVSLFITATPALFLTWSTVTLLS